MSIILGTVYWQLSISQGLGKFGMLLFAVLQVAFSNLSETPFAVEYKFVAYKHVKAGMYPPWAYTLSATLMQVPTAAIETAAFSLILYFMARRRRRRRRGRVAAAGAGCSKPKRGWGREREKQTKGCKRSLLTAAVLHRRLPAQIATQNVSLKQCWFQGAPRMKPNLGIAKGKPGLLAPALLPVTSPADRLGTLLSGWTPKPMAESGEMQSFSLLPRMPRRTLVNGDWLLTPSWLQLPSRYPGWPTRVSHALRPAVVLA